ncbi:helix-turn-helix transcriptional regulator [Hymenobacter properus]|uniref:Helix-turn-helix transcriptional regulator n=1 Tax=Hymenobacter properus TaxID=2791026 RepID=A0A931FNF3_9BACT|nr:AraC family transcriptional regulator [Hymenobacter properus]MBF9142589.1 helix-turn-helix transcriptional regulator [Hymenobacter properus]MBR7721397.1 helix-turn-helix transcriptional regulator [Microvirga sp. SRT04]
MTVYNLPHDLLPAGSPAPTDVLIRSYASQQPSVKNRLVLHYHMINLLIAGRKTLVQAAGTVTIFQDEILLMAAGHTLTSELLSDDGQFRSILLYFSPAVLAEFYARHAAQLPAASAGSPLVTFAKDDFIRNYIESLRLLLAAPTPPSSEIQRLKLQELLLYLLHTNPAALGKFQRTPRASSPELALRQVVETHLSQPITVDELAFLCHMSVSTFQRRFAASYGQPPQKWLLQQRMQRAAALLHQHQPPSDVYQQVGYESHSSFSEAFKKAFGVSPTKFKQQGLVAG